MKFCYVKRQSIIKHRDLFLYNSDNIDNVLEDPCESKLDDNKSSLTDELMCDIGIENEFDAFFDDIGGPEMAISFLYNNNETEEDNDCNDEDDDESEENNEEMGCDEYNEDCYNTDDDETIEILINHKKKDFQLVL
ncbi:hypothetical protein Glove_212g58 [Diversispora epigaea]|uniref:Transcription factor Iwr1 domain-containing protein n=1 Tax=Diversispora epigaea TaxID=1348612 RepID=A0A397IL66_9GLOM|nr:hypothetical protein Glove_212g58 [Diversispora epigaea]